MTQPLKSASSLDLEAFFQSAPNLVLLLEPDFTIVAVSDVLLKATKVKREDIVGKQLFDVFPDNPHDPTADGERNLRASLERVLRTGGPDKMALQGYDIWRPIEEGGAFEERYWNPINYPVLNSEGRVTHIVHQSEEVTELVRLRRRDAEHAAELAEAISLYQAIYDQGIFAGRVGLDGKVTDVNRSALEQCGYTREEVIGEPFWECGWWNRSPHVQAWVRAAFARAARGEPFRGVSAYFCADGSERVVEFACMPIKDESGRVLFVVPTGIDVTQRVQAEKDNQAAAILESITDGFFALDRQWRFTYVNRQAERLLGHPADYFLGKVIWNVYPGLIGSEFARAYHRAASDWVASSVTSYYPDHDRWYEVHSYPSSNGVSIYFRDASEQMRAEAKRQALTAQLELQARIFDTALSNSPDFTYTFNLEGRFTYANRALLAVLQKSSDQVVGKNFFELDYPVELAARLQRQIREVIETKSHVQDETPFTGAFGTRLYEYIFVPVMAPDGTVEAVAGSTRDITERKRAELATRRLALQLQRLAEVATRINSAQDVNSVIDIVTEEARNLIDADKAATTLVLNSKYPQPIQVVSTPTARHHNPVPSGMDAGALYEAVNGEIRPVRLAHDDLAKDPRWQILGKTALAVPSRGGWLAAPLEGRNGKNIGLIELADKLEGDFTDDDEAILVQLSRIAAIAVENSKLYSDLRENDQRKDEFLAMLAHELRNPLAAIANAVGLTAHSGLQEHLDWSMEVITRQTRHLTRLIDDLLDVSRISRGKIELRRDVLDVTPIIDNAAATVKPLMEDRRHTFHVSIERGNLWVNADPTRLEQVFVNLLNNAAKYSENEGHVWLTAANEGQDVVISVRDQGIGILPEKLPQMFELFAQGDRSLARSEGGLGIGLTIVKKLVEMHGGSVTAQSEGPDKGSEFTIRLPAAGRPAIHHPEAAGSAPSAIRKTRILVVDDSVDTARGLARVLALLGHEVATAHTGPEALQAAGVHRPDFILLDIGLPGMSGYEVASRLRQGKFGNEAFIVAVSGYGQEEDIRRSKAAGFDHHLIKPLDFEALISLLSVRESTRGGREAAGN